MSLILLAEAPQFTPYDARIFAAAAFIAAVVGLWKGLSELRKIAQTVAATWETFTAIPKGLTDLTKTVGEIKKEVRPNGGSSLRDSIDRIEGNVRIISARQDAQVNLSDDIWWEADASGMVTVVNKKFTELAGRDEREILGANWKNIIHPADLNELAAKWAAAVQDKRDTEFDYRMVRPDGHIIPVRAKSTAKMDERGTFIGWFGTVRVQVEHHHARPVPEANRAHLPRLLIVDDDVSVTSVFQLAFRGIYETSIANSGGAALQHYNSTHALGEAIDVIVLDYMMPGMDGIEVAKRIRDGEGEVGDGHEIGLFFFTGAKQAVSDETRALLHVEGVVNKPCDPIELRAKIDGYLRRVGKI